MTSHGILLKLRRDSCRLVTEVCDFPFIRSRLVIIIILKAAPNLEIKAMNIKLFSCGLVLLVSCASLIAAHGSHGHSHDGDDHHHHSHDEDVKPSFKYSQQANQQIKREAVHASHNHHGHSHDEPEHKHHNEKPKTKEAVPVG